MQPGQAAYDRGITVFSPDGRLYQVEYAREAVKRGATTIGLKYDKGVILIVERKMSSKLVEPKSIEKIYDIDKNISCATSGLVADARLLVDEARKYAQVHRVTYGEGITVASLVKKVCDLKQNYTQYGGARPFGTALLVAGTDELGSHLFETDPSGALSSFKATSIGAGRPVVMDIFEKEFEDNMSYEKAMLLGLKALSYAIDNDLDVATVECCVVEAGKPLRRPAADELTGFIDEVRNVVKREEAEALALSTNEEKL